MDDLNLNLPDGAKITITNDPRPIRILRLLLTATMLNSFGVIVLAAAVALR